MSDRPSALSLLFLHGGLADRTVWAEQIRLLEATIPCLAPDLPGHGSRADESPDTIGAIADEIAADLSGGCIAVGHSVGGLVALEMGLRHPDRVLGVITLESPITPPSEHTDRSKAQLHALTEPGAIDAWAARMVPPGSRFHDQIAAMMRATRPAVASWAIRVAIEFDTFSAVRDLTVPLLVVDGIVDDTRLFEANPNVQRAHTSGGSHYVQLDQAIEVHQIISNFVETALGAGGRT